MGKARDIWYIRLPSGQELKAKSTAAVNHHIQTGTIPKSSRARRSRDQEWTQLEWYAEFADTVRGNSRPKETANDESPPESRPLSGISARLDPLRLRTVGVRGLLEDLIAALDSTFARGKLAIAAAACSLIGLVWGIVPTLFLQAADGLDLPAIWLGRIATAISIVISILILAWANGLLARMTHIELSTMHPARWADARHGLAKFGVRLTIAYLLIVGGSILLMSLFEWLPKMLFEPDQAAELPEWLTQAALSAIGVVVEVLLFILIALTWMLAPLLVIEEVPLARGVREWLGLIRGHGARVLLAEMLALTLGTVVTLPIFLILEYAIGRFPLLPTPLRYAADGVALTPFMTFMAVANVFIYLDVKYERN